MMLKIALSSMSLVSMVTGTSLCGGPRHSRTRGQEEDEAGNRDFGAAGSFYDPLKPFGSRVKQQHYDDKFSLYLRGFRVPLDDPLLDQFDQRRDVVELRLLQDSLKQTKQNSAAERVTTCGVTCIYFKLILI